MLFKALVASTLLTARGAPRCSWMCDDPVCEAVCTPVCEQPQCQCFVPATGTPQCTVNPTCSTSCNTTYNGACPDCQTQCSASQLCETCDIVCPPLSCAWDCMKPTNCRQPVCELACEMPICSANITHMVTENGLLAQPGCGSAWDAVPVLATVSTLGTLLLFTTVLASAMACNGKRYRNRQK